MSDKLDKVVEKLGDKLDIENLIKRHKIAIYEKIGSGKPGIMDEIEKIEIYEKKLKKEKDALKSDSKSDSKSDPETGIPDKLRVKRPYTMSQAALEARQGVNKISNKSTGPKTPEGKAICARNAWKHGRNAATIITSFSKPCLTTCDKYPCLLITKNETRPGKLCLDVEQFVKIADAVQNVLKNKDHGDFNEFMTILLAKNLDLIGKTQDALFQDGVAMYEEQIDKDGNVLGKRLKAHPLLSALNEMLKSQDISLGDFMMTPAAVMRAGVEEDGVKTIADLMGIVGKLSKDKDE